MRTPVFFQFETFWRGADRLLRCLKNFLWLSFDLSSSSFIAASCLAVIILAYAEQQAAPPRHVSFYLQGCAI